MKRMGSMIPMSVKTPTPYDTAKAAIENVIAAARPDNGRAADNDTETTDDCGTPTGPPAAMIDLIIDETFFLLHQGALYSGMGEEAVTAAFASCLASAGEIWRRVWIWSRHNADEQILYQHYSDKEETVLGADFSLIFVDSNEGKPVYRVIVAQAKRLTAARPRMVNIRRKAFSKKTPNVPEKDAVDTQQDAPTLACEETESPWEDAATARLKQAFGKALPDDGDLLREAENYQLTRLLNLRKQVLQFGHAEFLYVMWPAPGNADAVNPILYEFLTEAAKSIAAGLETKPSAGGAAHQKKERYPTSFPLETEQNFRDFLLGYENIKSISEEGLLAALPHIKEESTATILVNASGLQLSSELVAEMQIPVKPDYQPASKRTLGMKGPNG